MEDLLLSLLWEFMLVMINHTEKCTSVMLPKLYLLLPPSMFSSTNKFFSHFTFLVSFNICKHSIILLAVGVEERT